MSYLAEFILKSTTAIPSRGLRSLRGIRERLTGKEHAARHELVRFGKMLHSQGFVAATDGNLSIRLDDKRVLVTPTCFSKGMMQPEDMVVVNLEGKKLSGQYKPSSETAMHLTIYRMRPDVGAVVHAHPCTATAFASAGIALDEPLCSEIVITLGEVPLAPYATTGTTELSNSLRPFIPYHDAILMANHGVVTYGETLCRAYMKMEAVEHFAKVVLATRQLGSARSLDTRDVEKLIDARSQYVKNARF
ncbi:MAG TPA: class II aldolase/adducin family protein [Candidatus Angelobacter sp.]|nr:class II aldolase/adducin family protein [Candidatus Angelobacter sp.]